MFCDSLNPAIDIGQVTTYYYRWRVPSLSESQSGREMNHCSL
ncbi:hypothetical protein GBAR_LOCUS4969, partial [Geodia barretti]